MPICTEVFTSLELVDGCSNFRHRCHGNDQVRLVNVTLIGYLYDHTQASLTLFVSIPPTSFHTLHLYPILLVIAHA